MENKLVDNFWCLESINYNDKTYFPYSTGLKVNIGCSENIKFNEDHRLSLPGFNFPQITGSWTSDGSTLQLNVDTFRHIFDGDYELDFFGDKLTLYSETTIIYCYKENGEIWLP